MDFYAEALERHEKCGGKVAVAAKMPLETQDDLSVAYTPGVAEPCRAIAADASQAWRYTAKANTVAVVSNGTAVLGLGNIGAQAAMPVMEGKAVLFKRFGGVDAWPLCIDATTPDEVVACVKALAPSFGGINLEDIKSPDCFEIERRLEEELDIPVFHDDQHGTAVVVTAALKNALKVVGTRIDEARIVVNGPGAAGTAIVKMLLVAGARDVVACDSKGILYEGRAVNAPHKAELAALTNPRGLQGDLACALRGADVFIGVSAAGALDAEKIASMADAPVVFAMANPEPEIAYDAGVAAGVAVMGTGRSDSPNQINNLLCFPGLFSGALAVRARDITDEMKLAAVDAIAGLVAADELAADHVIPSALDERVARAVACAVARAAVACGTARAELPAGWE